MEDSPYQDDHRDAGTSSSSRYQQDSQTRPSTSAQASFEAEAARIRARMPYRPPSPSNAPLSSSSFFQNQTSNQQHLANGLANGIPSFPIRDAPSSRLPQMNREGPIPRAPGAPREPDFYERLTEGNQRLFKLYGGTAVCGVIGLASAVYAAWNIHFMKVFSPRAKEIMMGVYAVWGYGGVVMVLLPAVIFTLFSLHRILTRSTQMLDIYSAILCALFSALLPLFSIVSYFKIKNQGLGEAQEGGVWDACLAPGADKWKRLVCGEAKQEIWMVQMLGLGVLGVASILYFVLALVHLAEAKSGGGSLFSRQKGYVRLDQNSLNPYEVHDPYEEDEEPQGHFKP